MGCISYNVKLKERARDMRKLQTKAEKIIWLKVLRNDQMQGYRFLRQKPIDNFILDFYCSKLLLGIEIDGLIHLERVEYDQKRTAILNSYGIKIIRYYNNDIIENLEEVIVDLQKKVTQRAQEPSVASPLLKGGKVIGHVADKTVTQRAQEPSVASPLLKGGRGDFKATTTKEQL